MKYLVRVERLIAYDFEVEAPTRERARNVATTFDVPEKADIEVGSHVLRVLDGPWIYGWSGDSPDNSYLGRPDQYLETKDLLVFSTPLGRVFTKKDVALLRERAERVIGAVAEDWNGAGCKSLTIRMKAPFGKLTDEQVATIMAPREP